MVPVISGVSIGVGLMMCVAIAYFVAWEATKIEDLHYVKPRIDDELERPIPHERYSWRYPIKPLGYDQERGVE